MPVEYSVEIARSHVEVRVSGVPDRSSVERMWADIAAACRDNDCSRVLGVSTTERAIELKDAMDFSTIFDKANLPHGLRTAWVQTNPAAVVMIELIIELTRKRFEGTGQVFSDEAEARRWLAQDD